MSRGGTAPRFDPGHDDVHHKDVATPGGDHAEVRSRRQHRPGPGAIAAQGTAPEVEGGVPEFRKRSWEDNTVNIRAGK